VVRGRAGVYGLRLLMCGYKFQEIRAAVDIFELPKFKTQGLVYGPGRTIADIFEHLKEGVFEVTHYGPVKSKCQYQVVNDMTNLEVVMNNMDQPNKSWRYTQSWYERCFLDDEHQESLKHAGRRALYTRYLLNFNKNSFAFIDLEYHRTRTLKLVDKNSEQGKKLFKQMTVKETYTEPIEKITQIVKKLLKDQNLPSPQNWDLFYQENDM